MQGKRNKLEDFWNFVKVGKLDNCWEWKGTISGNGYGQFRLGGKNHIAHRISYILHHGNIKKGMLIIHSCDNRSCVNPNHLREGTYQDNSDDKLERGRTYSKKGESHWNAKLTKEKVQEIRNRYIPYKVSTYFLAKEYGVGSMQIHRIISRKNWIE